MKSGCKAENHTQPRLVVERIGGVGLSFLPHIISYYDIGLSYTWKITASGRAFLANFRVDAVIVFFSFSKTCTLALNILSESFVKNDVSAS